jgi:hypothetical protein
MMKVLLLALTLAACSAHTEAEPLDCTSAGDKSDMVIVLTPESEGMPECSEISDPRFVRGAGRYWCCRKEE